ncbi:MAG: DUF4416 family protein [Planctomycetes bacterium]|nr:DUF4416 family protein [Planctomycetota bacterium]
MGETRSHQPVLLFLAAFSRHEEALQWAQQQAARHWGPIALTSDVFPFDQTDYYTRSMGSGLKKILLAFENLIDPSRLVDIKLQTNAWEAAFREEHGGPEQRPLNLDPGYLTEAKLVLATTKDRDHRIYLDRGIFAEVTLHYQRGRGWFGREWTYADYRTEAYHRFLNQCRIYLRRRIHDS